MINQSTFSFIMSKLYDIKGYCEAPDPSELKTACEKFIKASYHFIVHNYAENLSELSLKNFLMDCRTVLSKLETEYEKALASNHRRNQSEELQKKTKAIDLNLITRVRCSEFQKSVETLLFKNLTVNGNTQPEAKSISPST